MTKEREFSYKQSGQTHRFFLWLGAILSLIGSIMSGYGAYDSWKRWQNPAYTVLQAISGGQSYLGDTIVLGLGCIFFALCFLACFIAAKSSKNVKSVTRTYTFEEED